MAFLIFFLSGFAALLYQVIWQRLLALFSGADVYSVTIIIAAFMAGLGIGSLAGGRLADRLGAAASLRAFAAAELLIGAFGFISKPLYYDLLYTRLSGLAPSAALTGAILFVSLLTPTFLMGVSLPLLSRALTTTIGAAGRVTGLLYGWNTLGAASGAFVTTWLLVPGFGFAGSLMVGAAINVGCAVGAVALAVFRSPTETATTGDPEAQAPAGDAALSFRGWALVYALTGLIALGLEIVWFRLLGVMLKSTAFTFGTLLMVYLAGLGAGGIAGARRVGGCRSPGTTFLLLQFGLAWYAAVSIVALVALIGFGVPVAFVGYLAAYEPLSIQGVVEQLRDLWSGGSGNHRSVFTFTALYVVGPALLIGPPTFMMGFSFPYLQRASHLDLGHMGRRLGTLLASNIAGAVAGAVATGWLFLPMLGTSGSLRVLVGLAGCLAWPLALSVRGTTARRRALPFAAAALTFAGALLIPRGDLLWARLHGTEPVNAITAEDGSGLSLLKVEPGGRVTVFANGLGQSTIPFGGGHTLLGVLPVLVHPSPRDVLIIGLGSGDTAFAAAARPETQVTCIEIVGAQIETLRALSQKIPDEGVSALVRHPRISHRTGDGRAYLMRSGRRFDVIEADALRPTSAYAGNLYSQEYFALMKRQLKPGGLAVTWSPTERTRHTFLSVFPHSLTVGPALMGSNEPIVFDGAAMTARARAVSADYARAGIDMVGIAEAYRGAPFERLSPGDPRRTTDLNTDLFPRDEFELGW